MNHRMYKNYETYRSYQEKNVPIFKFKFLIECLVIRLVNL